MHITIDKEEPLTISVHGFKPRELEIIPSEFMEHKEAVWKVLQLKNLNITFFLAEQNTCEYCRKIDKLRHVKEVGAWLCRTCIDNLHVEQKVLS